MSKRIVLAAGGTGGHLFPAQSVGAALSERGDEVFYVTDHRCEHFFHDTQPACVLKIRRNLGVMGFLRFLSFFVKETYKCIQLLRHLKPNLVVGFGSYVSIPPVLAAQILRIPTVLHEQNAELGKANWLLSWGARQIGCSFEKTVNGSSSKIIWTGNPLRQAFLNSKPYEKLPEIPLQIVIVGGSQGSRIFSEIVPKAVMQLDLDLQEKIVIYQHVRPEDVDHVHNIYKEFKGKVIIKDFFHNLAELYDNAHLVISRSGASTVSELCTMGRPAILVPLDASLYGDQSGNADYLADHHACIVIPEYEFTVRNLKNKLESVLCNRRQRLDMAKNIHQLAVPSATQKLIAVMDQHMLP